MKISVLSLFRDSEKTIHRTLSQLSELEQNTDADFSFYFYENDSVDDTLTILLEWAASRNVRIISERLDYPRFGSVSSEERFSLMTYYRNKLLDSVKPLDSDYTLILDSDLIIGPNTINELLLHIKSGVVMVTPNTVVETIECKMGYGGPVYYDSLALIDKDGRPGMTWASCPLYENSDREKWISGKPVNVISAFGGAALIRTNILNMIYWGSEHNFCEHWFFCKRACEFGEILIVPTVKCSVECSIDDIPEEHIQNVVRYQRKNYDLVNT